MTTPPDQEQPLEGRLRRHLRHEADLTGSGAGAAAVSAKAARRRTRQRVTMLAATVAVVGGGAFVVTSLADGEDEPLDVAAGAEDESSSAGSTDDAQGTDAEGADGTGAAASSGPVNEAAEPTAVPDNFDRQANAVADWASYAGTQSVVVSLDDGFARLDTTYSDSGDESPNSATTLFRSTDGVTWTEEGSTDLPADTTLNAWGSQGITPSEDGYLALASAWSDNTSELLVAASPDLLTWTLTPLPSPDVDLADGLRLTAWADRATNGPNGVLILGSTGVEVDYFGLLGPELAESHCGYSSDGATVEVFGCGDDEVVAEFGPGDPFFEALNAAESFWSTGAPDQSTSWLLGPEGAEVVTGNLGDIVLTGIAATDRYYIGIGFETGSLDTVGSNDPEGGGNDFEDDLSRTVVVRSTDGITWERIDATGGAFSAEDVFHSILAKGDTLVVLGSCEGNGVAWVSTDDGSTWTMTVLVGNNEGTTSAWVDQAASGPAGFVVSITEDNTPPFDEMTEGLPDFSEAEPVSVDLDGAILTIDLAADLLTLVADDGTVLVEDTSVWSEEPSINWTPDGTEFLGPDGEVVFTASPELVDQAFEEAYSFGDDGLIEAGTEIEYEPPTVSLFGSADGIAWTQLELPAATIEGSTWISSVVVGDVVALIARQTQLELPAELLAIEEAGREPTLEENRALQEWYSTSSITEWLQLPLG